ncbi:hypothetical protein OXX59_008606, partial [Metschnikowia pulcherrima]
MRPHILSLATILATAATANAAYTATINGFADAVYDYIPECAKSCVAQDTSTTVCPYWEMGCLCVWTPWSSSVSECVVENCAGSDVASFTSAAVSACSSYGVSSPYWKVNAAASSDLAAAAAETTTASSSVASSSSAASSVASSVEVVVSETSSASSAASENASSSMPYSPAITGGSSSSSTQTTATTTAVARTATINGFADAVYDYIPECAKACVAQDTSSTRCPYWEMGCLCVWTPWSSLVGECVAESCKGADVAQFTSAATSACRSYTVPAPYWVIDATASSMLASARGTGSVASSAVSSSATSVTTTAASKL